MADQATTIPKGWKMTTLGEVISTGLISNHNNQRVPLSSEERSKQKGRYPYYGAASAIDFIDKFKYEGFYLLVAEDGTVFDGKAPMLQLVNGKFWVSNHSHVLQGKDEIITKFLFYILKNVNVAPYVTGAVQPKLTKENLYSISFNLPEKEEEQRAIAAVLSSLDDKIELLREQNKTLEATAQTIFKEWFVRFNFPNENGEPYATAGGKMIDSELGPIPEGWRVGRLGETGKIVCGKTPSKENPDYFGGKIPFIKIPDMHGELFIIKTEDSLTELGANTQKNKFVPKNSICVSCIATIGLVSITCRDSQTNQQINSIIPNDIKLLEYLYFVLKTMKSDLIAIGSGGSATLNINTSVFSEIEIIIPNDESIKKFHSVTERLFTKILNNLYQIQTLSTLRDTLLPKLMKGEIRVEGFKE
jgi:type I restriction enzyme S subunit